MFFHLRSRVRHLQQLLRRSRQLQGRCECRCVREDQNSSSLFTDGGQCVVDAMSPFDQCPEHIFSHSPSFRTSTCYQVPCQHYQADPTPKHVCRSQAFAPLTPSSFCHPPTNRCPSSRRCICMASMRHLHRRISLLPHLLKSVNEGMLQSVKVPENLHSHHHMPHPLLINKQ